MDNKIIAILAALVAALAADNAAAKTHRDPHQRATFIKAHPCPANGKPRGSCPGYIVDHIKPLCAGGHDAPSNMQWQTVTDAKAKDRVEREECRRGSSAGTSPR